MNLSVLLSDDELEVLKVVGGGNVWSGGRLLGSRHLGVVLEVFVIPLDSFGAPSGGVSSKDQKRVALGSLAAWG